MKRIAAAANTTSPAGVAARRAMRRLASAATERPAPAPRCQRTAARSDAELVTAVQADVARGTLSSPRFVQAELSTAGDQAQFVVARVSQTRLRVPALRNYVALRAADTESWWLCSLTSVRPQTWDRESTTAVWRATQSARGRIRKVTARGWPLAFRISEESS